MGRRKARRKTSEEVLTNLAIRVERYEAEADASINYDAYRPQYAFRVDESDPVYRFITRLIINGAATSPENRAGAAYELRISGDDAPSRFLKATLEDIQVRDEHGIPQYRKYRGKQVPIYKPPNGVGLLDKQRGEARWTVWINVQPQMVSDMLRLLGAGRELYIALQEKMQDRLRFVRSFSLQTTDPANE